MKNRILSVLLIMVMSLAASAESRDASALPPESGGMSDVSPGEFVNSIGAGWNLGNTFDAASGEGHGGGFSWLGGGSYANTSVAEMESAWIGGGIVTSQAFVRAVHDAGFRAIRIPVSWHKVAEFDGTQIRADWMARVKEVVDYAYNLDMHVILNTHHENSFIGITESQRLLSQVRLAEIWRQIAREFGDYGERLIFAGLNEPRASAEYSGPGDWNEWGGGIPETRRILNSLNQLFVAIIRETPSASGGTNNKRRFLIVPTHAASATSEAFDGFEMPVDPANRTLLAVHTYSPFAWAHNGDGQYTGAAGLRADLDFVAEQAKRLGVSVVLSEWGSVNNGHPENLAQRVQHAYDYVSYARSLGMATFWWDNNAVSANAEGVYTHTFGLFDRQTGAQRFPTIVEAIMRGMEYEPGVPLTPTVPVSALQVRLMAMGGGGWPHFTGDNVTIRGDGEYTVTINVGGVADLATLNIEQVGDIHERFHPATIAVGEIRINGTNTVGHTHNPDSNLSYVNSEGVRVVDTVLWNQWWDGGQILTTGIQRNPEGHFSLEGGGAMNSVSITFRVTGAAICGDCSQLVCTCGETVVVPPVITIERYIEVRVCDFCGVTKYYRVTQVSENAEVIRQRRAAKRRADGSMTAVSSCAGSMSEFVR